MRNPPQFWHEVAWKGSSQRKQVPPALVGQAGNSVGRAATSAMVFMVLVYIRFSVPLPPVALGCRRSSLCAESRALSVADWHDELRWTYKGSRWS